jgi:RNA polymerase sigma-70 factor (ECF subfamily)
MNEVYNKKRGGEKVMIEFDEASVAAPSPAVNLLELDEALRRLATLDPRKVQVVEMRFFGGLSLEETAEALNVSTKTVQRDWDMARAWLYAELSGEHKNG